MDKETKDSIKAMVAAESCGFQCEEEKDNELEFSTREHGNVGDEMYGKEDLEAGYRLMKAIREKHPTVEAMVDTCDEWVYVMVFDKVKS